MQGLGVRQLGGGMPGVLARVIRGPGFARLTWGKVELIIPRRHVLSIIPIVVFATLDLFCGGLD
jgi:hypothetical protein